MKKLSAILTSAAMLAAALCPADAGASNVKVRNYYQLGDFMAGGTNRTKTFQTFYNKDGQPSRFIEVATHTSNIQLNSVILYNYNEAGLLVEELYESIYATSPDDVDHEYAFKHNYRIIYEYNSNNQVALSYKQYWRQNATGADWAASSSDRYAYTYNADGTVDTETYWLTYAPTEKNPNPAATRTTTYTYGDQGSNPVSSTTVGASDWNNWTTENTYDAQGHLTRSALTYTKGSNAGKQKEAYGYTYDGDFLCEMITYDTNNNQSKRTTYDKVDNDPNHYIVTSYSWSTANEVWNKTSTPQREYVLQDYTGAELYVPEITATKADEASTDITVKIAFPKVEAEAYAAKIYRNGYLIATLDKEALAAAYDGEKWYTYLDANLKNGEHEYYAQIVTGTASQEIEDYMDGYISDIANVEVSKTYPAVTGLKATGYTYKQTWIPPTDDEDLGHTDGFYKDEYTLSLEWTPLTDEQVGDLGFVRYDVMAKTTVGSVVLDQITDMTVGTSTIEWSTNRNDVYVTTKYANGTADSEIITIDLTQLPNITEPDPLAVYGVQNIQGEPTFVKADITQPQEEVSVIYTPRDSRNAALTSIKGGTTVGTTFYALYTISSNPNRLSLGAFNMTSQKFMSIGEGWTSGNEAKLNALAYDERTEKLYGVAPLANASELYTISRFGGVAVKSDIAMPANTYYMTADDGKLYAMAAENAKFALYTIDLLAGTCSATEISVDASDDNTGSLMAAEGKLFFTNGTAVYTIDLSNNEVKKSNKELATGFTCLTTEQSNALPDFKLPSADTRILIKEVSDGTTTEYFYERRNLIARIAESTESGVKKYTKNSINDAGTMTATEVLEATTDAYGVESMQLTSSTTYTYDDNGNLTKATNSDGSWVSYTYDDKGKQLEAESYGNGDTTERTLQYIYDDSTNPSAILSIPAGAEQPDDIAMFTYDVLGNKLTEVHSADMLSGEYTSIEMWEYYPDTNIASAYKVCSTTELADGMPKPVRVVKYTMVGGDKMHILAQAYDGNGNLIADEPAVESFYYNYKTTAAKSSIRTTATLAEEGTNSVRVSFNLPLMSYTELYQVSLFRDGSKIKEFTAFELNESGRGLYTDDLLANGSHEYFAQAMSINDDDTYTGLQISNIVEIDVNTELPAVSEVAYISTEDNVVTIGWKNPEYPADYGFISNNAFIVAEAPVAGTPVTDAAATETTINFGELTKADVMVQTRYALGTVNSETTFIDLTELGLDEVETADGLTISIANKVVTLSDTAGIRVFDIAGKLVAETEGSSLDLSHLNGTYLVAVTYNGSAKVLKVML